MTVLPGPGSNNSAIVLYYSPASRDHLETILRNHGVEVYPIAGRAPHALEEIRRHPAKVVVIDCEPHDISISQAVRQVGRTLPDSLILTACAGRREVEVHRAGRREAAVESLEAALEMYADVTKANDT